MSFDVKTFFVIVAMCISVAAFYPYIRDVVRKKTQPHLYTWLIWTLTQGIAVAGIWYGGGGVGVLNLTVGWFFITVVLFLSFSRGTRNISPFDTMMLVAALLAILVWWQLQSALLAVLAASAIDIIGYIPTIRKTYEEPWSETVGVWIAFMVSNIVSIFALDAYNVLTLTYIVSIILANGVLILVCLIRRRSRECSPA